MTPRAIAHLGGTLALLLAACRSAPETPAPRLAAPRIDTLLGGVPRVVNEGPSAWADTSGWRFVLERTIAPDDGTPGQLGITDGLAIDGDGAVYAMQRKPARILVFDGGGQYLRTIGREGDGPGDVQSGMLALQGDTLLVQQPNVSRLALFRRDGTALGSMRTACCYTTPDFPVDSAGRIWVPGSMLKNGLPGWVVMSWQGKRLDTVLMPTDPEIPFPPAKRWTAKAMREGREVNAYAPVPLQPKVLSVVRHDGTLVTARNDRPELLVLRGADTLRRVLFPSPAIPLSPTERDSILRQVLATMRKFPGAPDITALDLGSADDLPAQWPSLTELGTDRAGRIWVGIGGARGELSRLLVFASDGVLLGDVPPPTPRFFAGVWGPGDRFAVATEREDGTPVIAVYRLEQRP